MRILLFLSFFSSSMLMSMDQGKSLVRSLSSPSTSRHDKKSELETYKGPFTLAVNLVGVMVPQFQGNSGTQKTYYRPK